MKCAEKVPIDEYNSRKPPKLKTIPPYTFNGPTMSSQIKL